MTDNNKCFGCGDQPTDNEWCDRCGRAAAMTEIETVWMDTTRKILTTYKASLKATLDIARQLYASAKVQMVVQKGAMYPWNPSQVRLTVGREL
jgi:hypothetical protein